MRTYTSFDMGHRHSVRYPGCNSMTGFGQAIPGLPAVPGLPTELPPLPGYVTEQNHVAALAAVEDKAKKDAMMYGVGGIVVGGIVGMLLGGQKRRR